MAGSSTSSAPALALPDTAPLLPVGGASRERRRSRRFSAALSPAEARLDLLPLTPSLLLVAVFLFLDLSQAPTAVVVAFKALPCISMAFVSWFFYGTRVPARGAHPNRYRVLVALGLLLSALADLLNSLGNAPYVTAIFIGAIPARLCYTAAFCGTTRGARLLLALPGAATAITLLTLVHERLDDRSAAAAAIFAIADASLLHRALSRIGGSSIRASQLLAAAAAAFLLVSDFCDGLQRFGRAFSNSRWAVLSAYFAGQLLMALSSFGGAPVAEPPPTGSWRDHLLR
jgi:uncharacterized membrane protein YhhN